jgi:NAD(P)-dependent dehydrogenase (short-subunit alcohol dehydrogenase family)
MVTEFVRRGFSVVGCGRTGSQIAALTSAYPDHLFHCVDVSSDAEVRTWAEATLRRYGPPDVIINNAAVLSPKAPLWEIPEPVISNQIDINLKGVVNVIRHFAPAMIIRQRGLIVNFSSRWGSMCERNITSYCATKWAIVGLTRGLAEELRGANIAVVALNPGIVRTEMLRQYLGAEPTPERALAAANWAQRAVPFILQLSNQDSGECRDVEP